MIPRLADTWLIYKNNTFVRSLADTISCKIDEKLNGEYDLELVYPIDGLNAENLVVDSVIGAMPRVGAANEPFKVYETSDTLDGLRTVRAHHIVYDTSGIVIEPFTATGITAVINALNTHYNGDGIEFVCQNNGITDAATVFTSETPASLFSLIGAVAAAFGAELSYEYDAFNSREKIIFNAQRGQTNNSIIGYGINLTAYEKKTDSSTKYTKVFAFAQQKNADGTITTRKSTASTGESGDTRYYIVDMTSDFDGLPSAAQLNSATSALAGSGQFASTESTNVDFVPLANTTEYKGSALSSDINLGDTLTLRYKGTNSTLRAVETVFDAIWEKYDKVVVGDVETNIADTIVQLEANTKTEEKTVIVSNLASALTINSSTWTNVVGITLPAGTWLITARARFSANVSGYRCANITKTSGGSGIQILLPPASGNATQFAFEKIVSHTSTTNYYLNAYQTSGSQLTMAAGSDGEINALVAVKIA